MSLMLPLMYRSKLEPGLIELRSPAVDSRITFTRASSRTYFDSAGVLQTATTDVWPREFDPATGECLGRSVWAAATNLLLRSEEFDNASWVSVDGAATVTANSDVAPDGATTADTIEDTSNTLLMGKRQTKTVANNSSSYCGSIFIKKTVGTPTSYPILNVRLTGGTGVDNYVAINTSTGATVSTSSTGGAIDCGDYWRLFVTAANNSTGNTSLLFTFFAAGNSTLSTTLSAATVGSCVVWGAQLEAGNIATPYIPTTSATVTRALDAPPLLTLSQLGYSATAGTLIVRATCPASVSGTFTLASFNDNTANEVIRLRIESGNLRAQVIDGGVSQADLNLGAVTANQEIAASISYTANSIKGCLNGGTVQSDVSATIPTVDRLMTGYGAGGDYWQSWIKLELYIPRVLSDAEHQVASTV